MVIRLIKEESDYKEALKRIDELWGAASGTPEGDELDLLATLVELYEEKHYPIELPDPVEAIKFRMEQAGLTRKDLEKYIGSRSKVSEVLNRKRPLSLKMIRALHKGLGIPAEILLQQQGAVIPDGREEIDWKKFPIREMIKRGWLKNVYGSIDEIRDQAEEILSEFLAPLGQWSLNPAKYRRHIRQGSETDAYSLLVWQARIVNLVMEQALPPFDRDALTTDFLSHLAGLSYYNEGPTLAKELLGKKGIHFVVEPHLPKTFLDGIALRLPDGSPVISLTLRYDRVDNFWFSLFHELAHVALHFDNSEYECFIDEITEETDDKMELKADRWAADALLPAKVWSEVEKAIKRYQKEPYRLSSRVRELAEEVWLHPAIIAGRIRYELKNYKILSGLLGKNQVRRLFF